MKTEREIVEYMFDLLQFYDPQEDDYYLDEGQQAELSLLEWILDRDLTPEEETELEEIQRKVREDDDA